MFIYLVQGYTLHSKCIAGIFLEEGDAKQCAGDKTKLFENAKWPDARWKYIVRKLRVLDSYKGLDLKGDDECHL